MVPISRALLTSSQTGLGDVYLAVNIWGLTHRTPILTQRWTKFGRSTGMSNYDPCRPLVTRPGALDLFDTLWTSFRIATDNCSVALCY